MRNTYLCCDGDEIIGRIVHGEKFPFGTVSKDTYESGMNAVNENISNVRTAVNTLGERETALETKTDALAANSIQQNVRINQITDNVNTLYNDNTAIRKDISEEKTKMKTVEDAVAVLSKCFTYEE